jgi:hypothetical protein
MKTSNVDHEIRQAIAIPSARGGELHCTFHAHRKQSIDKSSPSGQSVQSVKVEIEPIGK